MKPNGFTLIELMVAVVIVAILGAIALPSYTEYVQRGRIAEATNGLAEFRTRMEIAYNNNGNYGADECAVALPGGSTFGFACTLSDDSQNYSATATGTGPMAGFAYAIDGGGNRSTTQFKGADSSAACWLQRGTEC